MWWHHNEKKDSIYADDLWSFCEIKSVWGDKGGTNMQKKNLKIFSNFYFGKFNHKITNLPLQLESFFYIAFSMEIGMNNLW